jgi:hypothetical protein
MGITVNVLNRRNQFHRGRSKDKRASKRRAFRNSKVGIQAQAGPNQHWWQKFQVSMLLRKWRLGE